MSTEHAPGERPYPLRAAAREHAPAPSLAGAAAAALLLALGVIRTDELDTVNLAFAGAAVVVTALTGLLTARRVARAGEAAVTPVADPRTADGEPLVARSAALLDEALERLVQLRVPSPARGGPDDLERGRPISARALLAREGRRIPDDEE